MALHTNEIIDCFQWQKQYYYINYHFLKMVSLTQPWVLLLFTSIFQCKFDNNNNYYYYYLKVVSTYYHHNLLLRFMIIYYQGLWYQKDVYKSRRWRVSWQALNKKSQCTLVRVANARRDCSYKGWSFMPSCKWRGAIVHTSPRLWKTMSQITGKPSA